MMPAMSRAVLGLGAFIVVGSLLMLLIVKPGTGEFVITLTSLALGLLLGVIAVAIYRFTSRHERPKPNLNPPLD